MEAKVSGSMIPTILGLNQYDTPFELWARIRSSEQLPENEAMTLGKILEPTLLDAYGVNSKRQFSVTHPEKSYFTGTLDAFDPECIWEVKTTRNGNLQAYFAQIQWYLMLCHLNGYTRKGKLLVYRYVLEPEQMLHLVTKYGNSIWSFVGNVELVDVQPDELIWEYLEDAAERFYNCLVKDIPPKEPETYEEVRKMFQRAIEGTEVIATEEDLETIERIHALEKSVKEMEDEIERLKVRLMLKLKDSEILILPTGEKLAMWKEQSRTALDISWLKKEHPDIYKRYSTTTKTRVFRIMRRGKK